MILFDGFKWGVATSAYQIEGAWNEEGKVPSIWDRYSHQGNMVLNGHTGDVACDHYALWKDDVKLLKELGVNCYRFSISWSRVISGPENISYSTIDADKEDNYNIDTSINYKGLNAINNDLYLSFYTDQPKPAINKPAGLFSPQQDALEKH